MSRNSARLRPARVRNWAEREEIDTGVRPGTTSADAAELARLRKENAELRPSTRHLDTEVA